MSRLVLLCGPLLDAVMSGASCLAGEGEVGLLIGTIVSGTFLLALNVMVLALDALALPDVLTCVEQR